MLVDLPAQEDVHRLLAAVRSQPPPGFIEAVAGARSLLIVFSDDIDELAGLRLPDPDHLPLLPPPRLVTIPVVYDGPDLEDVASAAGLMPDEVARRHSTASYTVAFLGFSPGFAYLAGGDPRLAVDRLPTPRTAVPTGSVAVAGDMTAVYPQPTPGGWRLIGRTDAVMFDPGRAEPALLSPGDRVRFERVARLAPSGQLVARRLPPPPAGRPAVEVLEPGPLLTIQDGGRRGWRHAGVPVAGAADRGAAARANVVVGNGPDRALLESTLGGCRFRLHAEGVVAVTGARADLTVDGLPARPDSALRLPAGSELVVNRCRQGVRVYIAFAGGLDAERVLGSQATDTLSGLGPPPLMRGDRIPLGDAEPARSASPRAPISSPDVGLPRLEVAARWGPRDDWLSPDGRRSLSEGEFVVAASSDRTGIRLSGPSLSLSRRAEIPSEGMVAGAIQVPPGGNPIVLMRNHPTTGGYPVVAVVDEAGVDLLAQAPPGCRVEFSLSR